VEGVKVVVAVRLGELVVFKTVVWEGMVAVVKRADWEGVGAVRDQVRICLNFWVCTGYSIVD
jgi:hypothetical protein